MRKHAAWPPGAALALRAKFIQKNYVFTYNNYDNPGMERLIQFARRPVVRYGIAGREVGGHTGTRHLQGYFEFDRPVRLDWIKREAGVAALHLEIAKGSQEQNIEYCSKEGDIAFEHGDRRRGGQGARSDLLEVKEMLDSGESMRSVAESHFGSFCRHHKAFRLYRELRQEERAWRTQVVWLWGPTGTGKSWRAMEEARNLCPGSVCRIADQTLKWFEPYAGHKGVVLDDFTGDCKLELVLRLFDRYPEMVPIKGGFVPWVPRIVWVTSNFSPNQLWRGNGEVQHAALERRIDEIIYMQDRFIQ